MLQSVDQALTPSTPQAADVAEQTSELTSATGDASTIEPSLSSAIQEGFVAKRSQRAPSLKKFSPEALEKIIRSLAKLVEAFAALAQAYKKAAPAPIYEAQPAPTPIIDDSPPDLPDDVEEMPIVISPEPPLVIDEPAPDSRAELPLPAEPEVQSVDRGRPLELSSGFLWKPVSDKDGNLAILLPPRLLGRVTSVAVLSPDGSRTLQTGRYAGSGNGGREHFRFSKPGGDFPDGSIVLIKLDDGSRRFMKIRDTEARLQK